MILGEIRVTLDFRWTEKCNNVKNTLCILFRSLMMNEKIKLIDTVGEIISYSTAILRTLLLVSQLICAS